MRLRLSASVFSVAQRCAVLLMIVALAILVGCGPEAPPRAERLLASTTQALPTALPYSRPARGADPRALGDPNAPITVVEYSDYQCPFCAAFTREARQQIVAQYVQTGKVYLVYRDFPLNEIHPSALLASHVANCAATQQAFWPMHERLFAGQQLGEWGRTTGDLEVFLQYARDLGLDAAQLRGCVAANQQAELIAADFREGASQGVRSTPSFTINGQLLVGARSFEAWQTILDGLLTE